ncbi:MAG: hypothetical protein ACOYOT_07880 [Bacteroidales bacterium]
MKRLVILSIIFVSALSISAQSGLHQHDGFYLSLGGGISSGSISDKIQSSEMKFDGTGGAFDFKIGGAINKNLLLHATLSSMAMTGPKVTTGGLSVNASNDVSLGQAMLGVGLTYYTPTNFFFSGSVGLGNYTVIDSQNNKNESTDNGLAFQLKLGKEWWVSKNWGLGVSAVVQSCNVSNEDAGITEKLSGTQFGILFNATFN